MTRILKLENRGVIRLKGPDARSLLQGLITHDIELLNEENAVYAALLTPQGKFLFDMIIVADSDDLLLDVEVDRKADLVRRLMMYKLRADTEILDEDLCVWALFDGATEAGVVYDDPRHKSLQKRVIAAENPVPGADALTYSEYEERRIRHGVPDGSRDIAVEKHFWLETGAERLNGVSFTKGCFVGQELTARMKHRMTLKKSIVPMKSDAAELPAGTDVVTEAGKKIAEITTSSGGYGLAYVRLEHLDQPLLANGEPIVPLEHKIADG